MRVLLSILSLLSINISVAAERQSRPTAFGMIVSAETYADPSLSDLTAAGFDFDRMQAAMIARGVELENLRSHSNSRPEALAVTKPAVMASFDDLAARVRPNDTVFVYFGGHGLQVADTNNDETDGLDEAFVFPEFKFNNPNVHDSNLFIDDEFDVALNALLSSGAYVVFVADFCHSGDSTRGAVIGTAKILRKEEFPTDIPNTERQASGKLFAAFASPADRSALQSIGPIWAAPEAQQAGSVLTLYLVDALKSESINSYRQLQSHILLGYDAHRRKIPGMSRILAPPRFEGVSDRALPPHRNGTAGTQTLLYELPPGKSAPSIIEISYGLLTGVRSEDVYEIILPGDDQFEDRKLAAGRVSKVSATTAELTLAPLNDGSNAPLYFLDHMERPLDYGARLLLRRTETGRSGNAFMEDLIARKPVTVGHGASAFRVVWDSVSQEYEMIAGESEFRIPGTGETDGALVQDLADFLKVTDHLNTLANSSEPEARAISESVKVTYEISAGDTRDLTCAPAPSFPTFEDQSTRNTLNSDATITATGCDTIWLDFENRGGTDFDLTVLMLEPTGQVSSLRLYPTNPSARMKAGAKARAGYQFDPIKEARPVQLAVVAVSAPEHSHEIISFHHLCRPAFTDTLGACSGVAENGDETMRNWSNEVRFAARPSAVQVMHVLLSADTHSDGKT